MATLRSALVLLAKRSKPFLLQQQSQRSAAYWNKHWKPSPEIPRTPEERAAAAKKYGLRPEDYTCLESDEIGDYPHLPIVNKAYADPYEDYDMPGERRNYGEPLHPESHYIGHSLWDPNQYEKYTIGQQYLYCFLIMFGFLAIYWVGNYYPYSPPEMPRQYPFNNLYLEKGGDPALEQEVKHYTFEPATED